MNKSKRQLIGVAVIDYDETGTPLLSTFKPADFVLNAEEAQQLLLVPAKTTDDAVKNSQSLFSAWFLNTEIIETADRETSQIETKVINCEKWPAGTPKLCELAFYFVTSEPQQRRFTGVR